MDIKIDERYKQQTFCKKAFHYARQFTRPILNISLERGLSSIITTNYERRRPYV